MNSLGTALALFACLLAAIVIGMEIRRRLPQSHLDGDTKDVVKLSMGLVATMAALLLGLLVSSAKGSYDMQRTEVSQLAAKIALLDRVLGAFGSEANEARGEFRQVIEDAIQRMWPDDESAAADLTPNKRSGDAVYRAIEQLAPQDETQRTLKSQATTLAISIGELRSLLFAQSGSSVSRPLLVFLGFWLVVIFLSFSVLAPRNLTAGLALGVSAFSVAAAVYLILELDRPFAGLIRLSSDPMVNALKQMSS